MAELLVKIDPKLYRKYITMERGKQILYVELRKALYGTLRAALLFWQLLIKQLQEWGFKMNPYDSCVANKEINGKQCTIVLSHVDDLKISHKDPEVVTEIINLSESSFGKEAPITKKRGKIHEYLGMTIDYSCEGKVKFSMIKYIQKMLDQLPIDMDEESATPAADHLFTANDEAIKLDEDTSDLFHHNVVKVLFLCKRARPDIQTAVAFLCTRVQNPDVDEYKKLARVMKYLRATSDMPLTLEADGTTVIKWWADAAFAVHADMKSHTGGCLSLGKGVIYGTSTKHKLNTKSSTEAELVGVNDVLPQVVWTCYFLEAQGFKITDSIIYQDNQSAILLEKNGKASSSKRTRHINIRYFFVKDRIEAGETRVEYCPTKKMWADYFTKPLQGSLFQYLQDLIMNHNPQEGIPEDYRSVLEREALEPVPVDNWTVVQTRQKNTNKKLLGEARELTNGTEKENTFTMVNGSSKYKNGHKSTFKAKNQIREYKQGLITIRKGNEEKIIDSTHNLLKYLVSCDETSRFIATTRYCHPKGTVE